MRLNTILAVLLAIAAAIIIGCGGGGGGGDTTGTTDGTTDGGTTGINTGIFGRVQDAVGNPIRGAAIKFYNNSGARVGSTAMTNASGNFAAELPTNATQFTLDISGVVDSDGNPISGNYFNQFTYNGDDYLANDTSCLANAPAFGSGQAVSLGTVALTPRWMGPPAPPTGCLGG